ncbi:D-2-hydroxyacid dehydrogenase [Luteolibacter flavescens]|uniref:D-2-hydroxyacid dehydrogenase n=1 Tax=Luteolibacter flavescens TaxID=1859460 RepID=A0ABT3FLU4_9BACT|nr:D-2-hydroxyacid dehydrogenase [Luteolibacter flavescens]MCW1884538.1 D-2-hydroxyacid dehydrogenase [Luteolibacter flavescens]
MKIFTDLSTSPELLEYLREGIAPHELLLPAQSGASVLADVPTDPLMQEADIVLGQPRVDAVLSSPKLKWLQVSTAGYTRYDTADFRAAVKEKGVPVSNSSHVYDDACAEHVIAFMLANARQLPRNLKSRCANGSAEWNGLRRDCKLLQEQSLLIVGYGAIAERVIELLQPFRMSITAMRRTVRGDEKVKIVTPDEVSAALAEADHVINILPDNAESLHWFNAARFAQMKPGAIYYNIGRGTTTQQDDLAATLKSGHLGAAWLDVTDPEPLPDDHVLWTCETCHITPHTAGGQYDEARVLIRHFIENLRRFEKGEKLVNRIM